MLKKILFKDYPVSYSRFLRSGEPHVHHLKDARECVDIDFFRRSISLHYQHLYSTRKRENWIYRATFFILGLLFLILGSIIFFKTINFSCSLFFKNGLLVKNSVNALCMLFSGGSFAVGYSIHPEREAIQYLVKKVEKELNNPSEQLQLEFNKIMSNLADEWNRSHHTIWINKTVDSIL